MSNKRFDFLGVKISAENILTASRKIKDYNFETPNYICFPDASVVKAANEDPILLNILNNSFLTFPDGVPSKLAARLYGLKYVNTVSGYFLVRELLESDLTHYFYGGDHEVLEAMKNKLKLDFPQAKILGFRSPPFLSKEDIGTNTVIKNDMEEINKLRPNLIWVGISSPKQDYLMYNFYKNFDNSLFLGIGGVFLYLSDTSLKSPEWMKKLGIRWAYRLFKEPKRLWPKYYQTFKFLSKNSSFFISIISNRLKGRP